MIWYPDPMESSHSTAADGSAWPHGESEMARRVREFDWTSTPLGSPDGWSESLRGAVQFMLEAPLLATLAVGPDRLFLYNDIAREHYGDRHPAALGRTLADAFPHEYGRVAAFYDRVFAGESVHIPAQALDPSETGQSEVFDAYLTPIRDIGGTVH